MKGMGKKGSVLAFLHFNSANKTQKEKGAVLSNFQNAGLKQPAVISRKARIDSFANTKNCPDCRVRSTFDACQERPARMKINSEEI
jgi:hypothetical protein